MTKKIRDKSDYEKKGAETSSYPSQFDNADYGKKRKAKTKSIVLKNTTTGQVYGYKTIAETFSSFLITEADKEDDTRLPQSVIGEITGLIKKGAKDLAQAWKHAGELVHTAYHVANVKRPSPDKKGAWRQYEELLKVGVKALADTRGLSGSWRQSKTAYAENFATPELDEILTEASDRKHRIFVKVRDIGHDSETREFEVDAMSVDEVIHSFINQAKRNGRHIRIEPDHKNHVTRLVVYVKGLEKTRDEQLISIKDWSI